MHYFPKKGCHHHQTSFRLFTKKKERKEVCPNFKCKVMHSWKMSWLQSPLYIHLECIPILSIILEICMFSHLDTFHWNSTKQNLQHHRLVQCRLVIHHCILLPSTVYDCFPLGPRIWVFVFLLCVNNGFQPAFLSANPSSFMQFLKLGHRHCLQFSLFPFFICLL